MELRNSHAAFGLDGSIDVKANDDKITITRSCKGHTITLEADLTSYKFEIIQ